MQLGVDERDTVEQLLDHGLLVPRVLLGDLSLLDLGLLVDRDLRRLRVAGVLRARPDVSSSVSTRSGRERRTEASNALNSSSLNFL